MLCDDNGLNLYYLKVNLTEELARYRIANVNYVKYVDLQNQLMEITKPNYRNFGAEESLKTNLTNSWNELLDSSRKLSSLETAIKKIEPAFKLENPNLSLFKIR
jgi:hypothetical protein